METATETRASADAERLRSAFKLLVRRFSISERADVACCGVTVAQAAALEALRSEGPMRMGSLGRRLGITPSTLTRNLSRLEKAGLVTREADPEDARAARVALTEAGQGAADRVEAIEQGFAESILDQLPSGSRERALEALGELLEAVRRATEGCCSGAFDHLLQIKGEPSRAGACGPGKGC